MLVEDLEHAPEADAIAVVEMRVALDIRIGRARPWIAHAVVLGQILVMLDVGRDPQGNARVAGPDDPRSIDDRKIVDPVRRQGHAPILSRRGSPGYRPASGGFAIMRP